LTIDGLEFVNVIPDKNLQTYRMFMNFTDVSEFPLFMDYPIMKNWRQLQNADYCSRFRFFSS